MIPKGLKIGDTFEDDGTFEVVGFDSEGRYLSKRVDTTPKPKTETKKTTKKQEGAE